MCWTRSCRRASSACARDARPAPLRERERGRWLRALPEKEDLTAWWSRTAKAEVVLEGHTRRSGRLGVVAAGRYRGTSLIRSRLTLGPFSRPLSGALRWSYGRRRFLMSEVTLQRPCPRGPSREVRRGRHGSALQEGRWGVFSTGSGCTPSTLKPESQTPSINPRPTP